jgi:hypothetical protein
VRYLLAFERCGFSGGEYIIQSARFGISLLDDLRSLREAANQKLSAVLTGKVFRRRGADNPIVFGAVVSNAKI